MFRLIHHEKWPLQVMAITTISLVFLSLFVIINDHRRPYNGNQGCETGSAAKDATPENILSLTNSSQCRLKRLPQVIIIGSRKSGTRALLKFLGSHPAVRAAPREIHFFDKLDNYKRGIEWYQSQMPESSIDEVTIEKSPAYFVTKEVPERIRTMNSTIKLVVIFRDPVTRLISDFSQLIANKIEASLDQEDGDYALIDDKDFNITKNSSVEAAWKRAETSFEKYVVRPDGGIDELRRAVRTSMYSVHLEHWRSIFPDNQFHYVDGEALITQPHVELRKLELFLGLTPSIKSTDFVYNSKKGFYCLVVNNSVSENYQKLPGKSSDASWPIASCLSKKKGRRHVAVQAKLLEELQRFYKPYNEYLYSMTGINFRWYKTF